MLQRRLKSNKIRQSLLFPDPKTKIGQQKERQTVFTKIDSETDRLSVDSDVQGQQGVLPRLLRRLFDPNVHSQFQNSRQWARWLGIEESDVWNCIRSGFNTLLDWRHPNNETRMGVLPRVEPVKPRLAPCLHLYYHNKILWFGQRNLSLRPSAPAKHHFGLLQTTLFHKNLRRLRLPGANGGLLRARPHPIPRRLHPFPHSLFHVLYAFAIRNWRWGGGGRVTSWLLLPATDWNV